MAFRNLCCILALITLVSQQLLSEMAVVGSVLGFIFAPKVYYQDGILWMLCWLFFVLMQTLLSLGWFLATINVLSVTLRECKCLTANASLARVKPWIIWNCLFLLIAAIYLVFLIAVVQSIEGEIIYGLSLFLMLIIAIGGSCYASELKTTAKEEENREFEYLIPGEKE